MAKIKPVKPGTGTAKKPAEAATTESRQTRGVWVNRNESRQTGGLPATNRNESLARR